MLRIRILYNILYYYFLRPLTIMLLAETPNSHTSRASMYTRPQKNEFECYMNIVIIYSTIHDKR